MSEILRMFTTRTGTGTVRRIVVLWLCCSVVFPLQAGLGQDPPEDPGEPKEPKRESKVGKRLIREVAESPERDVMAEIMRLMTDAGRRLDIEFDPGGQTQALQRDIVERLDRAILTAAKQRRRGRQRASSSRDRRSRPDQPRGKEEDGCGAQSQADSESS